MATGYRFSPVASVSANDYYPAWKFNTQVRNNLNYLLERPRVAVYRSSSTALWPADTWQAITFGQESYDTTNGAAASFHTTTENSSRIVLGRVGLWLVEGYVTFSDGDDARNKARIVKNGAEVEAVADMMGISGLENPLSLLTVVRADAVTDFVELQAWTRFETFRILGGEDDVAFRATWLGDDPESVTTWTAPTTASTGTYTSSKFNTQVKANLETLHGRPSAAVYHSSDQTLSTGSTYASLAFDSELWDGEALHDTSTNNERITLKRVGVWFLSATVTFGKGATSGDFSARIRLNGTTEVANSIRDLAPTTFTSGNDSNPVAHVTGVVYTSTTTDYCTVDAFQESGSNLDVLSGSDETNFRAVWLGG